MLVRPASVLVYPVCKRRVAALHPIQKKGWTGALFAKKGVLVSPFHLVCLADKTIHVISQQLKFLHANQVLVLDGEKFPAPVKLG